MANQLTPTAMFVIFMLAMGTLAWANGVNIPFLGSAQTGPDGQAAPQEIVVKSTGTCDDSVTLTVDYALKYTESTDLTAQNATIFVRSKSSVDGMGTRRGVFTEGTTLTVSQGDFITVFNALDPAQTTYSTSKVSGKVPCDTRAIATSDPAFDGEAKVYTTSTAATVTMLDAEDFSALPVPIIAGESKSTRVKFAWATKEGYGMADGNTLACRLTTALLDEADTVMTLDGKVLGAAKYKPSGTRFAVSQVNQTSMYWAFPAIDGKVTPASILEVKVKADANLNPAGDLNVSCELFDTDYFETNDGEVKIGVEDSDDNSNVGRATEAATFTLEYS